MSDERIDELRGEMDQVIAEMEYLTGKLRHLRRRQHEIATARLMASPRVVAGPFTLQENMDDGPAARSGARVLTHPTCGIPCARCDDELPGAAA